MDFVNLYLETEYTLTSSPIKIDNLISNAKEYGFNSLAITDLNNMYGALKFYKKCTQNGIKPIIGLELKIDGLMGEKTSLVCYAINNNGYRNLLKLASLSKVKSDFNVRMIQGYMDDVLVVIPCEENEIIKKYLSGEYKKAVELIIEYKKLINNLYLGVNTQTNEVRNMLDDIINFGISNSLKCVAFNKVSYLNKEDYEVYKVLRCIGLSTTKYNDTEKELNSYLYKKNESLDFFRKYPQLIAETINIKNLCNVKLEFSGYRMPVYSNEIDTKAYLKELAVIGLKKRLELNNVSKSEYQGYANRLFYELDVISKMGFADYFLIVYDFIKYAKKNKIMVGPGRGSAPGSLVAYSLGITELDPIKYGLLFERFLNPERVSMPDIDTDFPDCNRDEVIKYMGEKYGKNKVAHIGTFGTFGPRSAIRDVARVMELDSLYLDEVLNYVDNNVESIEKALDNKVLFKMYESNERLNYLLTNAMKLQNLPRHVSIHAAGIIVSDSDLTDYTALQEGINGLYQTQFEASDLEEIGLVKIDFLGLKNLTIIDDVIRMIPDKDFDINKIRLDDEKVYQMLANKDTDGVFQLESAGMRNLLMQLKTSSFEDVYNALALYRPGPMEIIPSFVRRKFGEESVEYLHPDLEEILKSTYGNIVYQEQIILIAQKFAGYSLGEADILRRAVSKKKTELLMSEKEKFINGSIKQGYTSEQANRIFDYILKFANYGFNKSHSVAYSLVSYRMAYLKCYYPKEFMAVLMGNNIGKNHLLKSYISSCNKYKVKVLLPNINISEGRFVSKEEGIYYSLLAINGLGEVTINAFLEERNANGIYSTYDEFIKRTQKIFNKKNIEMLIYSGALDVFGVTRKSMIDEYDQSIELANYSGIFVNELSEHKFSDDEYNFENMSNNEKIALGINLKYDIFKQFSHFKTKYKTTDLCDFKADKVYNVLFVIDNYRVINTKKGEEMAFLTISDDTESLEGVIFPSLYKTIADSIAVGKLCLGEVKAENRQGKLQCVFNRINVKKSS